MRCNRKELAKILGYDVKTIDGMVKRGMPYVTKPSVRTGRSWMFDTVRVFNWLAGHDREDLLKRVELRIALAKATLKEIKYAEATGVAVNVEEVGRRVDDGDAIVKSRLLAIPGRMAQLIARESDPAVVKRMLEKEFVDALAQLDLDWRERG